jgi:hypothetical protein
MSLSLAAVALAAFATAASAQSVTLSLDIYHDSANAARGGAWQLRAIGSNNGIAGVDTALNNSAAPEFTAPTPAFKESYDNGTKPYTTDQDGNAATLDMLFGQIPVAAPGPQTLQYAVGVNGLPDLLGAAGAAGAQIPNNVLLAHGTFTAGNLPSFVSGGSEANVFTALGTATDPPAAGTIVQAAMTTQVRTNVGQKAGDANLDGDVDVFQFNGGGDAQILTANLGKSGKGIIWQSGDFNGDKDVDVFQFNGGGDAQILVANLGTDQPAGQAAAIYDFATGELTLDLGTGIGVAGFEFPAGYAVAQPLDQKPENPAQRDQNILAFFNANGLTAGTYNLGALLPAGIGSDNIDGAVRFSSSAIGANPVPTPVTVINETIIPEPASIAMLAMGLASVVVRRRRVA